MKKIFETLDKWLDYLNMTVMTVMMALATIVAFINVVLRYVFNSSLVWAGELTSYLFIWSALFGAAYGFKIGLHIGVTAVIQSLKPKIAKVVLTISLIVIFIYLCLLVKWGYDFVIFNYELEQVSIDLHLPFWIIYLCVPITMSIAAYQVLLKIIATLKIPADKFSYDMIMKEQH
ncbi:TRAP transporter small permease [Deferribacter thermophilus]|uniref:TRAP transporter small permease n=1 Tax=Deferribacter thermophilus TaxID=53573 RepID=UPI003C2367B4